MGANQVPQLRLVSFLDVLKRKIWKINIKALSQKHQFYPMEEQVSVNLSSTCEQMNRATRCQPIKRSAATATEANNLSCNLDAYQVSHLLDTGCSWGRNPWRTASLRVYFSYGLISNAKWNIDSCCQWACTGIYKNAVSDRLDFPQIENSNGALQVSSEALQNYN
jgi:hypothetical protein